MDGKILKEIISTLTTSLPLRTAFPGLREVLTQVRSGNIDHENYLRGVLNCIKLHDAFSAAYAELGPDLQSQVAAFMDGADAATVVGDAPFVLPLSPISKRHFAEMEMARMETGRRRWLNAKRQMSPKIYEDAARRKVMVACPPAPPSFFFFPPLVMLIVYVSARVIGPLRARIRKLGVDGNQHAGFHVRSDDRLRPAEPDPVGAGQRQACASGWT